MAEEKTPYLFGQIAVTTVRVEGVTRNDAQKLAEEYFKNPNPDIDGVKDVYLFQWIEGGDSETTAARNSALEKFLELMQKIIPMTPCNIRLIIPGQFDGDKIVRG